MIQTSPRHRRHANAIAAARAVNLRRLEREARAAEEEYLRTMREGFGDPALSA